jgi:phosphoenolpyruvate carboxykinase (GTP)
MIDRVEGRASGKQTPIGTVPATGELKLDGLDLDRQTLDALLHIDQAGWQAELADIGEYLRSFGERMPQPLHAEQQRVAKALDDAAVSPRAAAAG